MTEAGLARRRAASACDECHTHKSKCSGRKPRCGRCEQRGLSCTYRNRRSSTASGIAHERKLRAAVKSSPPSSRTTPHANFNCRPPLPCSTGAVSTSLLSRDVVRRHIDAYFEHIYPLQGYDFLHYPTVLEKLHSGQMSPILCTAICATVAMFLSPSDKSARTVAIEWSAEVDHYLLANMNRLEILNLQLMVLSMFQHFAYRQFGRVWQMHGSATRLALAFQLNDDSPVYFGRSPASPVEQECRRRLMWSLFVWDKLLSAGIDEFVGIPDQWMRLSLPCNEHYFQLEMGQRTGTLSDGIRVLSERDLGSKGLFLILQTLRHRILRTTKSFLIPGDTLDSPSKVQQAIDSLVRLRGDLAEFYDSIPPHLKLSDRNIFSHANTSEFASFITLHTWFFLCSSDLFRICLPGMLRESAPMSLLAVAPDGFVLEWQSLAISYALRLSQTWSHLQDLQRSGRLKLQLGYLPMNPATTVMIHQSTKLLLLARRFRLCSRVIDPLTGTLTTITDSTVEELCCSNISYLDGMAAIAPISAVVQQDVRDMFDKEVRRDRSDTTNRKASQWPVGSEIQRRNVLSRYHPLSISLANSEHLDEPTTPKDRMDLLSTEKDVASSGSAGSLTPPFARRDMASFQTSEGRSDTDGEMSTMVDDVPIAAQDPYFLMPHSLFQPLIMPSSMVSTATYLTHPSQQTENDLPGQDTGVPFAKAANLVPEYSVAPSQFDMGEELDWFMMSTLMENQPANDLALQSPTENP